MDKHLVNVFNLESNVNNITPIDKFKIFRDFDCFISVLKDYASQHELTEVEQFYFNIETDPRRKFFYQISQSYYYNYFIEIYFILSNTILINQATFTNLYKEKDLLPEITNHTIDLYKTMD